MKSQGSDDAPTSGRSNPASPHRDFLVDFGHCLFLRQTQQEQLCKLLDEQKQQQGLVALIHGKTGVGKTALAESLRPVVERDGGYFLRAKFHPRLPAAAVEPHAAVVTALTTFCQQVLLKERREDFERIRACLRKVSGELGVLLALIPELQLILGEEEADNNTEKLAIQQQPDERTFTLPTTMEPANCQFKHSFRTFLQAVCNVDHPLVFLLDDLHWADEASLDLLSLDVPGCCLVCTLDENHAVNKNHRQRLEQILAGTHRDQGKLVRMHLCELTAEEVHEMLSAALNMNNKASLLKLSSRLFGQTRGNFFFMREYLRALNESGALWYLSDVDEWVYEDKCAPHYSSVESLVSSRIARLPGRAQETLRVAACLGSRIDMKILSLLSTSEGVSEDLAVIANKGLVTGSHDARGTYEFAHDAIHEAVYELMSENDRCKLHYRIGRELWRTLDLKQLDELIFVVVSELMAGRDQVTLEKERIAIAKLCLRAGERAVMLSSFYTAHSFLMFGIALLEEARYWRDEYRLSLALYSAAAEVSYCIAEFEDVDHLVNEVLVKVRSKTDALRVQSTEICGMGTRRHVREALEYGVELLRTVGIRLPRKPSKIGAYIAFQRIRKRLRHISDDAILRLPTMDDPEKLAVVHLLSILFRYAMVQAKELCPFLVEHAVRLTMDDGISVVSSLAFAMHGSILCRYVQCH